LLEERRILDKEKIKEFSTKVIELAAEYGLKLEEINRAMVLIFNPPKRKKSVEKVIQAVKQEEKNERSAAATNSKEGLRKDKEREEIKPIDPLEVPGCAA
jgi:hypothetical protein